MGESWRVERDREVGSEGEGRMEGKGRDGG